MNYSSQGAAALAEMSPFSRPASIIPSGWRPAPPMEIGREAVSGNLSSSWQTPSYPLVGFDPKTFIGEHKVAVAIAAAILAGGIAYYYGYR